MPSNEANKPGRPTIPNRQGLYARTVKHATAAIDVLGDLLKSPNENIRLGAARTILSKCLPDLKHIDNIQDQAEPISIIIDTDQSLSQKYNSANNLTLV